MSCLYPLYDISLSNNLNLRFYFINDYELSRKAPKRVRNLGIIQLDPEEELVPLIKRKALNDNPKLS